MRRLAPLTIALPLVLASAASAQVPTTPTPAPTPPEPAHFTVVVLGLHEGKRTYTVAQTDVRVAGRMNTAAAGDGVTVQLIRDGKVRQHHLVRVNKSGRFSTRFPVGDTGGFAVRVVHKQGVHVAAGQSKRVHFSSVRGELHQGSSGPAVRLLQRQLARLAYATPRSGYFDDATARAVLAYRKVNGMSRITSAHTGMTARLFQGIGGFALRHPRAGRHVEADLARQVLVLADRGRAQRIYTMSSGKPSTPTVVGSFRFYRKEPGYNSHAMFFSNYFVGGYAIHGYAEVPPYAASHGCLRVPIPSAVSIYRAISLGERIFVYTRGRGSTRISPNAGP